MKLTTTFVTFSLALTAIATPLGNRAVFRRHTGVPENNARRYILQSRTDAPPACIAKASAIPSSTDIPNLSNSTITDPTATGAPVSTSTDGSDLSNTTGNTTDTGSADGPVPTDTTSSTGSSGITTSNSTDTSSDDTSDGDSADNSIPTGTTNSTDTTNATNTTNSTDVSARRRRGIVSTSSSTTTTTSTAFLLDVEDLAFEWQSLCLVSGGGIFVDNSPCVELAGANGFNALLADADPCAQQNFADSIVTFAKTTGVANQDALIAFALKYRRHPRASASILGVVPSTLYCTQAPSNSELSGIINAQPDGVNPGLFGSPSDPLVPFGSDGTCPFGATADVSTCSCIPASTDGTDINVPNSSADSSTITDPPATASGDDSTVTDASATASASGDDPAVTDSSVITSTDDSSPPDPTANASLSDSSATATDAAVPTVTPTATDSAVVGTATPTDLPSVGSSSITDSTDPTVTTSDTPAPSTTSGSSTGSDISGDINDPSGRRRK